MFSYNDCKAFPNGTLSNSDCIVQNCVICELCDCNANNFISTSYTELKNDSYSNKATSILTKISIEPPQSTTESSKTEFFERQTGILTTFENITSLIDLNQSYVTTKSSKSMPTGSSYKTNTYSIYSIESESVSSEFFISTIITELIVTESTETMTQWYPTFIESHEPITSPITSLTDKQCQTEVTGNITTMNETLEISLTEYLTTEEYEEFTTILYEFLITEEKDEFEFLQNAELNNEEFIKNGMSLFNFPDSEI